MGDRGFAGKWSHYEESLRVPLIVYDPRVPGSERNKVNSSLALNIDIPATILNLAGVPIPETYQGRSLMPIVNGDTEYNGRGYFLCEHLRNVDIIPQWEGVHTKQYVYARYFGQEPVYEFLHDLDADPDELKNFAGDASMSEILNDLRKKCDELIEKYTLR
jgi:arylsulfatase A-like enzyme